ncbi:Dcp2, box A domain-containing protein [Syncephalis fuscata]|nr:Dcp2, box A domain-containing protein [Syncephalis fuscata]
MAFATATFTEVLDDLSSRFIINVPEEELASVERICFQVEQAHWYYEDFIREQNPSLPSFSLKQFSAKIFRHCPLLQHWADEHEKAYGDFLTYKFRVPVCGAIILNETLDKCLLVKGWTSKAGWGFPRGKINKDESYASCAAREVFEETGFDLSPLVDEDIYLERTIREQHIRLFIIPGIPESTQFNPQTRKEISKISWYRLLDLPTYRVKREGNHHVAIGSATPSHGPNNNNNNRNRFYMVIPFVNDLRRWIERRRQGDAGSSAPTSRRGSLAGTVVSNTSHTHSHLELDVVKDTESERLQLPQPAKGRQNGHGKREHRRTRSKYQSEQMHTVQPDHRPQHPVDSSAALLEYLNSMTNSGSNTDPMSALLQLVSSSDNGTTMLNRNTNQSHPVVSAPTNEPASNVHATNVGDRLLATLQGKPITGLPAYPLPQAQQPPALAPGITSHMLSNSNEPLVNNNTGRPTYGMPTYDYSMAGGSPAEYPHVYKPAEDL